MVKQYHSFLRMMSFVLTAAVLWGLLPAGVLRAAGTFSDVDAGRYAWAVPSIQSMAAKGVLTGYPDGTFRPAQTVSKAEWTAMVYRLFDKYRPNLNAKGMQKISYFTDLPESHWAYKPIGEIYNTSFSIGGYGLNRNGELAFRPEMQLTRLQLALMLYAFFDNRLIDRRISDNDACSLVSTYKDIPIKSFTDAADYAGFAASDGRYAADGLMSVETQDVYPALMMGSDRTDCSLGDDPLSNVEIKGLASLQASGIMTPTDDGYFRPLDRVTRAEAVTILDRIYRFLKKNYWLSDYSSVDLDSSGSGTAAGSTASGSGSDSPFTYNPNSNVIVPDKGSGAPGSVGSDKATIRVQDYFDDKGIISKDLQLKGEIETAVQPQGKQYMLIDLKSLEKVDLYVIIDGQVGFVKMEELPLTLKVSGVTTVGIKTQQRVPNPNKKTDFTATLSVKVSDDDPTPKKKK